MILEDELQRITLETADGSTSLHQLVTGIVVAVLGCESSERRGYFKTESMLLPGSNYAAVDVLDAENKSSKKQGPVDSEDPLAVDSDLDSAAKENLLSNEPHNDADEYVVLVSGLNLRGALTQPDGAAANQGDVETLLAFQQLVDELVDTGSALRSVAKRIGRLVFAGNMVRTLDAAKEEFASQSRYMLLNRRGNDRFGTGVEALKLVDNTFVQLAVRTFTYLLISLDSRFHRGTHRLVNGESLDPYNCQLGSIKS